MIQFTDKKYDGCMLFFHFLANDTEEELLQRLTPAKEAGFQHILASYKTKGMEQACFDNVYYTALDRLVSACKTVGLSFWLEDYAPFPTGSANGAYKEAEYADKNKLMIDERHLDISGPYPQAVIRIDSLQNACYSKAMHRFSKIDSDGRQRIGVVACRIKPDPRGAAYVVIEDNSTICLDDQIENGILELGIQTEFFMPQEGTYKHGYMMDYANDEMAEICLLRVKAFISEHL